MENENPKLKRGREITNRMSELNEEHEKMMSECGKPKGQTPVYVEFTTEQRQAYERNRAEHKKLLAELVSIMP
jgi:hypothetical protein